MSLIEEWITNKTSIITILYLYYILVIYYIYLYILFFIIFIIHFIYYIIFFYIKKDENAAQVYKKIQCITYGKNALKEYVCQKWFARFHSRDFSVKDALRSVKIGSKIKSLIDINPRYMTREIANISQISKSSMENHLHQLDYVSWLDVWVLHKLNEAQLNALLSAIRPENTRKMIHFLREW